MFWKKWCSKHSGNNIWNFTVAHFFDVKMFWKNDVPNIFGMISKWKFTFWLFFSISKYFKRGDIPKLLVQFPKKNLHFDYFFSISKCSENGIPKALGRISIWKLTFWTLFPFQDVLKEVMSQTLLEQFPNENSHFENFVHSKMRSDVPITLGTISIRKLTFWTPFFVSESSERSDAPNTLGKISIRKLMCWTLFLFQDSERKDVPNTLSWKNFPMKTHVLKTFSISRCS